MKREKKKRITCIPVKSVRVPENVWVFDVEYEALSLFDIVWETPNAYWAKDENALYRCLKPNAEPEIIQAQFCLSPDTPRVVMDFKKLKLFALKNDCFILEGKDAYTLVGPWNVICYKEKKKEANVQPVGEM